MIHTTKRAKRWKDSCFAIHAGKHGVWVVGFG